MIVFNTQTDKRWANEIMTKKEGIWVDLLCRWGCYVTALSNIISIFNNKQVTPKDLNDVIIALKAYKYLDKPETPEKEASLILIDKLLQYFPSIKYETNCIFNQDVDDENSQFIIEMVHPLTKAPHFVNLLSKKNNLYIIFDVEDGIIKCIDKSIILSIRRFKKV
jgi:hypothetical protein